jgi:molybdopterin synthase catalytic subunit
MIRVHIQAEAFDVATEMAAHDGDDVGAVASFVGTVRGSGGLTELFLEHHPVMTPHVLNNLGAAAAGRWALAGVTLIHRVGALGPGDAIVLVIASSRHRADALDAVTFLIDRLKVDAPFWKRERFADGRVSWVEPRADDDARATGWIQTA